MILHKANQFGLVISSIDGTRPAATTGTSITPTQNTTGGAYATLLSGASLTEDAYAIEICINNIGISTVARDCLVTLAFDPAGGTSFTDWADLLCGSASQIQANGIGHRFWFPLWLKAGTTIGARGSVNSANLTAFGAFVRVYCKPTRPELIWCGQKVEQLGVTTASSTGTSVTAGTTSEGSWTQIGTTTRNARFMEFGIGFNNGALNSNGYSVDLSVGDASNKEIVMLDQIVSVRDIEQSSKAPAPTWCDVASGDIVYARTQAGPNAAGTHSIAVYLMGD